MIKKLIREERGVAAVEYAVLIGFITLLLLAALTQLNTALGNIFQFMADFFASVS